MTYPETRYHAEGGEASATYRSAASAPDFVYPNGTTVCYLATAAGTDGLFGLYRWEMGSTASGPGPHFHRTITESFYVLRGTVRIYDGRDWIEAGPDDFVHVPAGGIHGFRNESGRPASMLIHFAPGAPREAYFEGLVRRPTPPSRRRKDSPRSTGSTTTSGSEGRSACRWVPSRAGR